MTVERPFLGEKVFGTSDGGNDWIEVQLPALQAVVVTFTDAGHGWALAQDPAEPTTGQLFDLYATDDGGATWERLPDPPRDAYYLALRSPSEAWMGSLGHGPPHLYRSPNGGRSWQRDDLPAPPAQSWDPGGHGTTVQLLPQVGVIATTGMGSTGSAFETAKLFTSFDSGASWRYLPTPPPGVVGYQDALRWWAMEDTVLSKSSDAGQSWKRITDTLPAWQFVPHVLDANHAWAEVTVVGGFGLALTSDGGLHWTRGNVPPD